MRNFDNFIRGRLNVIGAYTIISDKCVLANTRTRRNDNVIFDANYYNHERLFSFRG